MYVGEQSLGPVAPQHKGLPPGTVVHFELGEADTVPEGIDLEQMVPDYELAAIYLNGQVWHSDSDKAAQFQAASPYRQAFFAKCAEIRTITAVQFVRDLNALLANARSAGYGL